MLLKETVKETVDMVGGMGRWSSTRII